MALEFAGFWRRVGAFMIDLLALSVISSICMPYGYFGFMKLQTPDILSGVSDWLILPQLIFGNLLSVLVGVAYFIIFWVWRGQTLGNLLFNIKVIRPDGSNVTVSIAFLRYLGYIVSTLVLFMGFIWIAFDKRKQGFHDKIAGTYVVIVPQPEIKVTNPKPTGAGV
ncbi:MAG: RDD family protein [Dehalococcoidales bacterium]|nr:RDD family protein [Dehalococcoidales bacterium]